jgi:Tol biopolymer transport system component
VRIHQQGVGTYNFRDDIGVVPAGGGTVTNLTANRNPDGSLGDAGCPNGGPAWSPDSTTIVFHDGQCLRPDPVTVTGWGSRLASVVVQSGALTLLTPIPPNTGTGFRNASHSPDGERLVFEYQSSSNVGSIGSLPATGGISPTLATAFGEKPTWRPAP